MAQYVIKCFNSPINKENKRFWLEEKSGFPSALLISCERLPTAACLGTADPPESPQSGFARGRGCRTASPLPKPQLQRTPPGTGHGHRRFLRSRFRGLSQPSVTPFSAKAATFPSRQLPSASLSPQESPDELVRPRAVLPLWELHQAADILPTLFFFPLLVFFLLKPGGPLRHSTTVK